MISIIDYGAGNIKSLCNALDKLAVPWKIVRKPSELMGSSKVILPGVGAAGSAMQFLLESGLNDAIARLEIPFLGICLGLQLLANFSEEDGVQCLSIIPGKVRRFLQDSGPRTRLKIPQIGWNTVNMCSLTPLTEGIPNGSYFYFVNSYYFDADQKNTVGRTPYGINFPSIVRKENFYGVQFHPEKSGDLGLQLLRNFCEKC